jgi:ABC-type transport system substrate-binding protein
MSAAAATSLLDIIARIEGMLDAAQRKHSRRGGVPHTLGRSSASGTYISLVEFDEDCAARSILHGEGMTMRRPRAPRGGPPGFPAPPRPRRANLVVQVSTEPPGLDLTASPASAIAGVVFYNVQEALIKVDRYGKLVPWLAERWYTTDSKNYTFFLRKAVRFHNGREMKAADVKYVFDRAVNPETKHPDRVQYEAIQDVIVKDDYTISVSLKAPDAMFLWTVARQGSVIYPRKVDTPRPSRWARAPSRSPTGCAATASCS